jgi:hypothetical protein
MTLTGRRLLVLLALALVPAVTGLRAFQVPVAPVLPCEFNNVERIVAVGDVHGAYDRLLTILRAAAVIDTRNRWIGGRTHLVQTGDVLDRGPDSRKALEFLRGLARDAERQGGRVHALIGNHEAMRLLGDFRYVVPGEYAAFTNSDSEATRRAVLERSPADQRARLEAETPLGMIEMLRAVAPGQDLGKYLRSLDTVAIINGIVFVHGGISPPVAPMTCAEINETVRRELGPDFEKTRAKPAESLTTREDGPLWYRGLANEPDSFAPEVKKILAAQHARAIVAGHSASPGPIRDRFDQTVFLIDTGMQPAYLPTGRASALEIRGDVFTAIYDGSRQVIAGGAVAALKAPPNGRGVGVLSGGVR